MKELVFVNDEGVIWLYSDQTLFDGNVAIEFGEVESEQGLVVWLKEKLHFLSEL